MIVISLAHNYSISRVTISVENTGLDLSRSNLITSLFSLFVSILFFFSTIKLIRVRAGNLRGRI